MKKLRSSFIYSFRYKKIARSILKKANELQPMEYANEAMVPERPIPKKKKKKPSRKTIIFNTFCGHNHKNFLLILFVAKTECKVCGKVVVASRLNLHLRTHSGTKSYLCDTCGRGFFQKTSLRAHIRYNHKGVKRPKGLLCTICGFTTDSKYHLEVHHRIHTDERVKRTAVPSFFEIKKKCYYKLVLYYSRLNVNTATKDFDKSVPGTAISGKLLIHFIFCINVL